MWQTATASFVSHSVEELSNMRVTANHVVLAMIIRRPPDPLRNTGVAPGRISSGLRSYSPKQVGITTWQPSVLPASDSAGDKRVTPECPQSVLATDCGLPKVFVMMCSHIRQTALAVQGHPPNQRSGETQLA